MKKASSLAEVLIVLAIISTTIIASTSLVIESLITVRENETSDAANGILVEALEIVKSPSAVNVSDGILTTGSIGQTYYFRLVKESTAGANSYMEYILGGTPITTCDTSSQYYLNVDTTISTPINACLQIQIRPVMVGTKTNYEITALVVYKIRSKTEVKFLRGYRTETFQIVNR